MMLKTKRIYVFILVIAVLMIFSGCERKETQFNSDVKVNITSVSSENSPREKITTEYVKETLPDKSIDEKENVAPEVKEEKEIFEDAPIAEEKTETKGLFCTLSVRCDRIFNDISRLDDAKISFIPENGIIFPETSVEFFEGESVFNVLTRELKKKKIHIEFVTNPMYNSAYVEGISNLYEFDCGANSGWVYLVNGKSASCGSSQYMVKNNDKIEWIYVCN